MNSSSLRYLLLKSYFPAAFLIAIILAILDTTVPPVLGQVRTVTVTVYVTLVQTVPVYVPVTAYVTVASVATSFITFTSTAVSISLGTVTLWNTVSLWNTVTTSAGGIPGLMPTSIFGQYSDVALVGGGVLGGVAVALASSRLIGKGTRARAAGEGTTESGAIDIDSLAELTMFEFWKSEDEELKDTLEQMHDMNELKKKMRDFLTKQKELRNKFKDILLEKFKDIDLETWRKWRDDRPQYKPWP